MPRKKAAPTASPQLPLPPPTLAELAKVEPPVKRRNYVVNLAMTDEEERQLEKREWADVREQRVFRLAFESDPYQINTSYAGLFKLKLAGIPDPMLKRIAVTESLVASIVLARQHHMAPFGREQKDRHSLGFKLAFEEGFLEEQSEEDKKKWEDRAKRAAKLLRTCGDTSGWDKNRRCSLGSWFKQTVKSALTVGRIATEIIYDEDGNFHSFRPQDAGCIFPAVKTTDAHTGDNVRERSETLLRKLYGDPDLTVPRDHESWDRYDWDHYDWVQVIDGQPVQVFTEHQMIVKNFYETPDVEWGGFPVTPLDTAVSEVLTRLSITAWNKIYFQNGRAAKGMIIIKSDEADPAMLQQVRQQFMAAINGVQSAWRMPIFSVGMEDNVTWQPIDSSSRDMEFQYLSDNNARCILSAYQMSPEELPGFAHLCLHPETSVWVKDRGVTTIGQLLGMCSEVDGFKVWTGIDWVEARAFRTGSRSSHTTTTGNGISIVSSPDHLFRVVDEAGEPTWRRQSDLRLGDVVLLNRTPVPGNKDQIPSYQGRPLTEDMMEVLGWLTGDGSIIVRKRGKIRHSKDLEFYYHHFKEPWIRDRHFSILSEFGLTPHKRDKKISRKQAYKMKRACKFKSLHRTRLILHLYNTEFVEWLLALGFVPSNKHKTIPPFVHSLPLRYRGAFLRGFFSADGSRDVLSTPSISIRSEATREQTKLLLLNMGIRTRGCEGTTCLSWEKNLEGGYDRLTIKAKTKLIIKDKVEFYERVGFLQQHKQPFMGDILAGQQGWNKVARAVAVRFAKDILKVAKPGEFDAIRHDFIDPPYAFQQRSKFDRYIERYGIQLPTWIESYHQEPVVSISSSEEMIEMVDIEVFDDVHAFMANGVIVHNSRGTNSQAISEGSNEYKLEAHRDVGIRPLVANFEDFLNDEIVPLVDEGLAEVCKVVLAGLDALTQDQEDAEKERLASTDGTMNDVLQKGEKTPLPPELAGDVPLNQVWSAAAQAFVPVGLILEQLLDVKGAKNDPKWSYLRDPFYWQQQESLMNQLQMVLQPPFDVLAPLVLPKLLVAVFGISAEDARTAAQQIVQTAQALAQQQAAAPPAQDGSQGGQSQSAQKSEPFAFMRNRQNFLSGLSLPAPLKKSN